MSTKDTCKRVYACDESGFHCLIVRYFGEVLTKVFFSKVSCQNEC